jgi:TPP-dependent indolepyruvate ferredoxin oxidoreductase alpha subunit
MKELIYFSSSDLMIQVFYKKNLKSIRYFSHRGLPSRERDVVEKYLITNIVDKTVRKYKLNTKIYYLGVEYKLSKQLNRYHLKNKQKVQSKKEAIIEKSVKDLIARSLSNYYFEQIGYTLIEARRLYGSMETMMLMNGYTEKLRKLVEAYNHYTDRKVSLDEIVPEELRPKTPVVERSESPDVFRRH